MALTDLFDPTEAPGSSFELRQRFRPWGEQRAERALFDATARRVDERAAAERRSVANGVRVAYDAVWLANERAALRTRQTELARERQGLFQTRVDAGLPEKDDLVEAAVDVFSAVRREHVAVAERDQARAQLSEWIGETVEAVEPTPLSIENAVSYAPSAAAREEAEAELRLARAERRVMLRWVNAEIDVRPDRPISYGIGVSVFLPVFRHFDGEVARRRAWVDHLQRSAEAREQVEDWVRAEQTAALVSAREQIEVVTSARDQAVEVFETHQEDLRPDQRLSIQMDLLSEEVQILDLWELGLSARRQLVQ